ncbi:MAG: phage terminase small subunit P27 family [Motiliproteus sp.]
MPLPKKPTNVKILTGTARADRLNPNEPKPDIAIPSFPDHLSKPAKAEWRRVTKELKDMGLICRLDRAAMAAYCSAYGAWVDAENALQNDGMVTVTPNGLVVQSAWLQIRNKSLEQMHKFAVEFGFTPASRSKVSAAKPDPVNDELAEYMARGQRNRKTL